LFFKGQKDIALKDGMRKKKDILETDPSEYMRLAIKPPATISSFGQILSVIGNT
jgi:hypothetical protein